MSVSKVPIPTLTDIAVMDAAGICLEQMAALAVMKHERRMSGGEKWDEWQPARELNHFQKWLVFLRNEHRAGRVGLALILALLLFGTDIANADHAPDGPAVVYQVVDGDTIRVQLPDGRRFAVRYIGVDTPEVFFRRVPDCYGREASARNRELVLGQTVYLERDTSDVDRFNRLLRHVWLDDALIGATLIVEGYGRAREYPPDSTHAGLFASLEEQAWTDARGLWGACPS